MKYRKLTSFNYNISELSLGTFPFKGWWGEPLSDEIVISIIARAVELGINFVDTADIYGLGEMELLLGKMDNGLKNKLVISTKGGRDFTSKPGEINKNFEISYLNKALESSLSRLKKDCI
jgi:aryl-alcohol dehydrogenase-like predicted oxidoreductase